MSNQQLYFAILVPVFAVLTGIAMNVLVIAWQAKGIKEYLGAVEKGLSGRIDGLDKRLDGIDKRLDRIESRLTTVEQDYKVFFQDITRIKSKVGL